jgi:hypothetical protein
VSRQDSGVSAASAASPAAAAAAAAQRRAASQQPQQAQPPKRAQPQQPQQQQVPGRRQPLQTPKVTVASLQPQLTDYGQEVRTHGAVTLCGLCVLFPAGTATVLLAGFASAAAQLRLVTDSLSQLSHPLSSAVWARCCAAVAAAR